jgi:hypothetical protein
MQLRLLEHRILVHEAIGVGSMQLGDAFYIRKGATEFYKNA